jgi:hypothetical protein
MIVAGWVAIALAVISVASVVSLALLFAIQGPWGTINDVGNALIGVLAAALALLLAGQGGGWLGAAVSVAGAAVAAVGSWLVISGTTGFLLAGFVSTIGFGLIGVWLALTAWGPMADDWFDADLVVARGAAVALIVGGVVAVPAALMGIDAFEDVPPWAGLFSLGWLGIYVLLPIAAFGLGRRLLGS